jgi:hypothetical protein
MMEVFILMVSIFAFILFPISWMYAMFAYPEEFGPPGPNGKYNSEEAAKTIALWSSRVVRIPNSIYKGIEWLLHAEFMQVK